MFKLFFVKFFFVIIWRVQVLILTYLFFFFFSQILYSVVVMSGKTTKNIWEELEKYPLSDVTSPNLQNGAFEFIQKVIRQTEIRKCPEDFAGSSSHTNKHIEGTQPYYSTRTSTNWLYEAHQNWEKVARISPWSKNPLYSASTRNSIFQSNRSCPQA